MIKDQGALDHVSLAPFPVAPAGWVCPACKMCLGRRRVSVGVGSGEVSLWYTAVCLGRLHLPRMGGAVGGVHLARHEENMCAVA